MRSLAIAALLSACGSGPTATIPSANPISTPAPTLAPTPLDRTNAEKKVLVRENIGILWCDDAPRPDWCKRLRRVDGEVVIKVDGANLTVGVRAATPVELAFELCRNVAISPFDDDAIPIGFVHVDVESAPQRFIAECDV